MSNPIYPGTGNKRQEEVDYEGSGPMPLRFSRIYNSDPQFGLTWITNYSKSVTYNSRLGVTVNMLVRPEGSFPVGDPDNSFQLIGGNNGAFIVTTPNGQESEYYDSSNRLYQVRNSGDGTVKYSLTYSTSTTSITLAPVAGLLIQVSDPFGHVLNLTYDAQSRLATMTDPSGGLYQYAYDNNGNLISVTYPDLRVRQYAYNEPAYNGGVSHPALLTGIVDESTSRFANYGYDAGGLAVLSEHAGGAGRYTISYATVPFVTDTVAYDSGNHAYILRAFQAPTGVVATDPLGNTRSYGFATVQGNVRATGASSPCVGACTPVPQSQGYDANGNVNSQRDFNGNLTCSTYDTSQYYQLTRNTEVLRIEGLSGTTCPGTATAQTRTLATSWDYTFPRLPASISVYAGSGVSGTALRTTAFAYDTNGNVRIKTITDPATSTSRTWNYTYDSYNRMLTVDGPRTDISDITTYTYYTCTTGAQCGQINTVTDAAGNLTTYNTYNANGQPLTITDPSGVATTLTYDLRQRLTSRQVGTELTSYSYYPTGLLQKVTLPDLSFIQYTYDAAHRLTRIDDGLGNHIAYTLDAMGNRTAERAYDPSNVLSRAQSRVYNTLSQMSQQVGSAGTAAVTTAFGYDNNGNQTTVNAPLGRNTTNAYDELNRLKQITDPASGITQFGYDANDNLTSVQDPTTLTTTYVYNGFGEVKQLVSPSTGTSNNTYDSGGNLATNTDARGAGGTYSYDTLNRVTQIAYGDQTLLFGYDAGTYGKGRLTSASDSAHSMSWVYDGLGRVTSKGQTVGGVTRTVGYGYTNGLLTSMTTPSGQAVVYSYANGQVTGITINGTAVLSGVVYEPFGPARYWSWGNSTTETRLHDTDGNPSLITGAESTSYSLDSAFRIQGISNSNTPAASWTYGYDLLDRVTTGTSGPTAISWTYDANGNRQTQGGAAAPGYAASALAFGYNNRGRMASATSAGTTSYVYNALGQRIQKSGPAGTTVFAYDEAGHLLGEYTSAGVLVQETVWLGDLPVATIRPGTPVTVYYVHADHLGTPRAVTRSSDNAKIWRWDSDPFGVASPYQNPGGLGVFVYNLRYPGQYFDGETGLNYNYFRDYDPQVGRYVESDPIGLHGGINTFGYVGSNPLTYVDPWGLAQCMYSVAEHTIICLANDGSSGVTSSRGISSGLGLCKNNNSCTSIKMAGPVTPDTYNVNANTLPGRQGWWALQSSSWRSGTDGLLCRLGLKRCGFNLHLGTYSEGCITFDKNDPVAQDTFRKISDLFSADGSSNSLTVIPNIPKGSGSSPP